MTKNFSILLLLIAFLSSAQIKYEKSYIVNNNGLRIECFIKNKQWNTYPTEIEYKSAENAATKIGKIDDIKEFGIGNDIYKRFDVQVDKSSTDLNSLSQNSNPEFVTEKVFLKLLIDGNIQFYKYSGNYLVKFFYKKSDEEVPKQLIYKKYIDNTSGLTYSNNEFRNQLAEITDKNVRFLEYKEYQIVKVFEDKNQTKKLSTEKDYLHLTLRPGLNSSTMSAYNNLNNSFDMGTKNAFRIGLELEYNVGFNKNKWALIFEPQFSTLYKSETNVPYLTNSTINQRMVTQYQIAQFPIGLRHYMYLNSKNRIFLNVLYSWNLPIKFEVSYAERKDIQNAVNKEFAGKANIVYGAGYSYINKYFLEARYQSSKLLRPGNKFNTLSLIFGYRFL